MAGTQSSFWAGFDRGRMQGLEYKAGGGQGAGSPRDGGGREQPLCAATKAHSEETNQIMGAGVIFRS